MSLLLQLFVVVEEVQKSRCKFEYLCWKYSVHVQCILGNWYLAEVWGLLEYCEYLVSKFSLLLKLFGENVPWVRCVNMNLFAPLMGGTKWTPFESSGPCNLYFYH